MTNTSSDPDNEDFERDIFDEEIDWDAIFENREELSKKYQPEMHLQNRTLHKAVVKMIQDIGIFAEIDFSDYSAAEKIMIRLFYDFGYDRVEFCFKDNSLDELINKIKDLMILTNLEVKSDILDKEQKELNDDFRRKQKQLLKEIIGESDFDLVVGGDIINPKEFMTQICYKYPKEKIVEYFVNIARSAAEFYHDSEVNEAKNMKYKEEMLKINYNKDCIILKQKVELEKYVPPHKDPICNIENLSLLLDFTKAENERNTKKISASRMIQNFCTQSDVKEDSYGSEKTWGKFFETHSPIIKEITGEDFKSLIDALFALEKHRNKVDMLFDVINA